MSISDFVIANPNKAPTGFISPTGDFFYAQPIEFGFVASEICDWYGYDGNESPLRFLREHDWDWITMEDIRLGLLKRYL